MFTKLRKILVKDGIKTPEYQQIFSNVIGYDDIKLFKILSILEYVKYMKITCVDCGCNPIRMYSEQIIN
jgi:hypothetical protein